MTMKLTFAQPYLSILSFPECELPPFTVLTGVNGSGKSHFLQAIVGSQIRSSVAPNPASDVKLFDWNSIAPNNAENFDSRGLSDLKFAAYNDFKNIRANLQTNFINQIASLGLGRFGLADPKQIATISVEQLSQLLSDQERARSARSTIDGALEGLWNNLCQPSSRRGALQPSVVQQLRSQYPRDLFQIDEQVFSDAITPSWGQSEPFRQSFAQLFVAYRDLLVENHLKRYAFENGASSIPPLTEAEIVERYNGPPWTFVNDTLENAGLDFVIDVPPLYRFGQYKPTLTKRSSGAAIEFGNLSSGEKVLMSFALCVYYAGDSRQISKYPRLLLLDEVDAPLHPSMCRMLIRTITGMLVEKYGLHVILTTHSPTTVAIAPDESIYVMRGNGRGIEKVTKGAALNVLTEEVPTVSLDFEGRRQVLVESAHDASVYERVYRCVKAELGSERSLEFIGVGREPSAGSGCDQVRHIVNSLVNAGNRSVFGLLDWDNANDEDSRIKVLAHRRRHSLESCMFDPLIVAVTLMREAPGFLAARGLQSVSGYLWFRGKESIDLQPIVDEIIRQAFPDAADRADTTQVNYLGGLTLQVARKYLEFRGHDLQEKLLATFPPLNRNAGPAGKLMRFVADSAFVDYPEFIPSDLVDALKGILSAPSYCLE